MIYQEATIAFLTTELNSDSLAESLNRLRLTGQGVSVDDVKSELHAFLASSAY